jgi:hypothetical protein
MNKPITIKTDCCLTSLEQYCRYTHDENICTQNKLCREKAFGSQKLTYLRVISAKYAATYVDENDVEQM